MESVEFMDVCWSYLFSCEWWRQSFRDVLFTLVLVAVLIPITPFAYLCVAPIVAVIEGMRKGRE
jgi:hypothetical protein